MRDVKGFTLMELLVVITVISIIATVVLIAINPLKQFGRTRDSIRKSDLRQIANALERYYAVNGSYPTSPDSGGTSCTPPGQCNWYTSCLGWDSSNPRSTSGPSGWIPNLAPNEIKVLPLDPLRKTSTDAMANPLFPSVPANGGIFCYIYNSNGVDYKLAAHCATEDKIILNGDPFYTGHDGWSCLGGGIVLYTPGAQGW